MVIRVTIGTAIGMAVGMSKEVAMFMALFLIVLYQLSTQNLKRIAEKDSWTHFVVCSSCLG